MLPKLQQLQMILDIEESEKQINEGLLYSNEEIFEEAKKWLK